MSADSQAERVPQYDVELKLASSAVQEWQDIARRLHAVLGLSRREIRRQSVELAYQNLLKKYFPKSSLPIVNEEGVLELTGSTSASNPRTKTPR